EEFFAGQTLCDRERLDRLTDLLQQRSVSHRALEREQLRDRRGRSDVSDCLGRRVRESEAPRAAELAADDGDALDGEAAQLRQKRRVRDDAGKSGSPAENRLVAVGRVT